MFDKSFPYKFITKKNPLPSIDFFEYKLIYSFKASNYRYIAEVEAYNHNMHVIKFYPKHLSEAANKFNVILNSEYPPRIIRTCINIMLQILDDNQFANFGFLGSFSLSADYQESKYMTQRYRIYKQLMLNLFSENSFLHVENQTNSAYLLLNKLNPDPKSTLIEIQKMFIQYYPELDSE